MFVIYNLGCDDSTTEPGEITEIEDCQEEEGNMTPEYFSVNLCWENRTDKIIYIKLALPTASDWKIVVYRVGSGQSSQFQGTSDAGVVITSWNGNNMGSGVFGVNATANDYHETIFFKIE